MAGGMGGHHSPSSETTVWLTPPAVLDALGGWQAFDLDPCAACEPRPWPTARRHYTRADNGLMLPWAGRVWLNPPYGGPAVVDPWLARMATHDDGIALVFGRTETRMWFRHVWPRAKAVKFLEGRLFFCRPDGRQADNNSGAPSCLLAYGFPAVAQLAAAPLAGQLVTL